MMAKRELIGEGAFDKVYRLNNGVVKYINYEGDRMSTSSFREIVFLNYLSHRNIVYPTKIDNKELRMNYGGYSFKSHYEVRNFSWDELRNITIQILRALDYMHKRKIIHCDIKPDNILMNGNHVYLCDFNISSINNGHNKGSVYTIWYRPLESLINCYNEKSDIWALGCTLYEIFTKHPLFKCASRNNQSIYDKITDILGTPNYALIEKYQLTRLYSTKKDRQIKDLTSCSKLNQLLELMLAFDVKDRPSASQLLDILGDSSKRFQEHPIVVCREFPLIKHLHDIEMISFTIYAISCNLLCYLIENCPDFSDDCLYQWIVVCCCSMLSDGDKIRFHDTSIVDHYNLDISTINFGMAMQDILELTKYNFLTLAMPS